MKRAVRRTGMYFHSDPISSLPSQRARSPDHGSVDREVPYAVDRLLVQHAVLIIGEGFFNSQNPGEAGIDSGGALKTPLLASVRE